MSADSLITAVEFYLRRNLRLKRSQPDPLAPLPELGEETLWDYAELAADRLERLRHVAEPVPVKRRNDEARHMH